MTTLIKTQCPNCNIYFDLPTELPELLHVPNTQMRCIHCQYSFFISENLVVSANDPKYAGASDKVNADDLDNAWLEQLLNERHRHEKEDESQTTSSKSFDALTANEGSIEPQASIENNDADRPILSQRHSTISTNVHTNKSAINQDRQSSNSNEEQSPIAAFLWIAGCLILVLSLLAQYVIFNLDTLIKNPVYAQRLQTVCSIVACRLPSADLDAFSIIEVDFKASKIKASNNFTDIRGSLENQSNNTQLLPSLKVTVYSNDDIKGEFIAMPEDYLLGRQNQLSAGYGKPFMFTIAISSKQISKVIIEPIY